MGSLADHPGRIQPRTGTSCGSAKKRDARSEVPRSVAEPFLRARSLAEESSWRRLREVTRSQAGPSRPEATRSGGQRPLRVGLFGTGAFRSGRLTRHDRGQRDRKKSRRAGRDGSSFGRSTGGCSTREIGHDLRSPRLPLGFGSRRSVESGEFPSGAYRQTLAGGWDGSQMPSTFRVLLLQRFRDRMS